MSTEQDSAREAAETKSTATKKRASKTTQRKKSATKKTAATKKRGTRKTTKKRASTKTDSRGTLSSIWDSIQIGENPPPATASGSDANTKIETPAASPQDSAPTEDKTFPTQMQAISEKAKRAREKRIALRKQRKRRYFQLDRNETDDTLLPVPKDISRNTTLFFMTVLLFSTLAFLFEGVIGNAISFPLTFTDVHDPTVALMEWAPQPARTTRLAGVNTNRATATTNEASPREEAVETPPPTEATSPPEEETNQARDVAGAAPSLVTGTPDPKTSLAFTFAGDIMAHPILVYGKEGGTYEEEGGVRTLKGGSYRTLDEVTPYLEGDIVMANLEFVTHTNKPPMKFPRFNGTPEYLAYFARYFNMFSVANNHFYDHGAVGAHHTMSVIKASGSRAVGGSVTTSSPPPIVTNIKGVDVFIAAYTMLDNRGSYEEHDVTVKGVRYACYINYYPTKEELLKKVVADMKKAPKDAIRIVSLHFGTEWTTQESDAQKKVAHAIVDAGADILVGHHPHVLRGTEVYEGKRKGIIFYSLGNFFSIHKYGKNHTYADVGAIVTVTMDKEKRFAIRATPTYTCRYRYVPYEDKVYPSRVFPLVHDNEEVYREKYTKYCATYDVDEKETFTSFSLARTRKGRSLFKRLFAPVIAEETSLAKADGQE